MKVLFLDIDGVLNSTRSCVALNGYPHDVTIKGLELFDMIAVNLIRGLCGAGDIRVVLSSTWRLSPDYKGVGDALDLQFMDRTPSMLGPRGREIAAWLAEHPEVEQYAILDDDPDMLPEQLPFFVQTDAHEGLNWEKFRKLCELFQVDPFDCNPARVKLVNKYKLDWSGT